MDLVLFFAAIIPGIGVLFYMIEDDNYLAAIVSLMVCLAFISVVIFGFYRMDPKITESTMITDTLNFGQKVDRPVKVIKKEIKYPYTLFKDYTEYMIITKEEVR
jgi:hypothetical protein